MTVDRGRQSPRVLLAFVIAALAGHAARAADITKANNLDNLGLGSSWTGGTAPTAGDVGLFDSTYNQSGALNTGGLLAVGGVRVTNPTSGVIVNNATAGQELAVGSSGVDLSSATQNLSVQRMRVDATQAWNVASGREFVIGNSATARAGVLSVATGGPYTIEKTGAGTVQLNTSNTNIGSVNWDIQSGLVRAIWNTSSAWGTGTITLGGGGIATGTSFGGSVGNWTWNNAISLTSSTNSFIDNQNNAGADRWLKLESVISGSGSLEFRDTGVGFTNLDAGFILAGTNTNTGTVTIASGAEVRVGGANPNTFDDIAGNNGKLAGDTASIVNDGSLTFSRLDAHTVANAISGSGNLRVGMVSTLGGSSTSTQTVRLTGTNTYSGTTTVNNGTLQVGTGGTAGSLGSGNVVNNGSLVFNRSNSLTIANTISGTGSLTHASTGTTILSGTNTYTGATIIRGNNGTSGEVQVASINNGGVAGNLGQSTSAATNLIFGQSGVTTGKLVYTGVGESTDRLFTIDGNAVIENNGSGPLNFTNTGDLGKTSGISQTFTLGGSNGGSLAANIIKGSGASSDVQLRKTGSGTWRISGVSTYSGATTVTAGTLLVDGSLTATSGLSVSSGAVLGGSGTMATTISGGGVVSPGNSPGITTATAVDPTGGLGFAFEFTATGSPSYANAAASVNDVLRLTDPTTPFTSSLSGGNVVDVYFDVTALTTGDTFTGGFYTDRQSDFLTTVENGTYAYWVTGNGAGTDRTFNGQGYFSLANFDSGLSVILSTVAETANFAGGTATGQVTQFVIVPEPATLALAAAAFGLVAAGRRRFR